MWFIQSSLIWKKACVYKYVSVQVYRYASIQEFRCARFNVWNMQVHKNATMQLCN